MIAQDLSNSVFIYNRNPGGPEREIWGSHGKDVYDGLVGYNAVLTCIDINVSEKNGDFIFTAEDGEILCKGCVYVFRIIFRINSKYFSKQR